MTVARTVVVGLVAACALALVASGATIGGIDAWKIVLAIVGLVIFMAGRGKGS
jgi:hypothetical protein